MCVAAIAWQAHPNWLLIVAANRDEYHERPTAPLALWQPADPGREIFAGRDLRAGGTWLGVGGRGRLALVTNYRVEGYPKPDLASRGALVTGWLRGQPLPDIASMNPFNLLLVDTESARVVSNYPAPEEHQLAAGVHGLSNGAFTQPWPKARQLCADLTDWLAGDVQDFAPLFAALANEATYPEALAGDGPEPAYSGLFIRNPVYGTRSSTVVAVDRTGRGTIIERRFDAAGRPSGETTLAFTFGN